MERLAGSLVEGRCDESFRHPVLVSASNSIYPSDACALERASSSSRSSRSPSPSVTARGLVARCAVYSTEARKALGRASRDGKA